MRFPTSISFCEVFSNRSSSLVRTGVCGTPTPSIAYYKSFDSWTHLWRWVCTHFRHDREFAAAWRAYGGTRTSTIIWGSAAQACPRRRSPRQPTPPPVATFTELVLDALLPCRSNSQGRVRREIVPCSNFDVRVPRWAKLLQIGPVEWTASARGAQKCNPFTTPKADNFRCNRAVNPQPMSTMRDRSAGQFPLDPGFTYASIKPTVLSLVEFSFTKAAPSSSPPHETSAALQAVRLAAI